jgi:hypothetical protein
MKILVTGILVFSLLMLSSNQDAFVLGQKAENKDDLVFNVQGLSTSPTTSDFQINGKIWKEICPSNQCQIEELEYSSYVVTPSPEDDAPRIYTTLYFNVHDDITNKDLTPLQKKFAEKYELSFSCDVNSAKDIIEQGNNVIYKCSGDFTDLAKSNREKTDPMYFFKVEGTYDTQTDSLNATGKYDSKV